MAVDISPVAVAYASYNADACGVGGALRVLQGSWGEPLFAAGLTDRLGGLVSNPPYIPADQMVGLQAEVGLHEPHSALDGGPGPGLDSLSVICVQARDLLMPGGFLALEVRLTWSCTPDMPKRACFFPRSQAGALVWKQFVHW